MGTRRNHSQIKLNRRTPKNSQTQRQRQRKTNYSESESMSFLGLATAKELKFEHDINSTSHVTMRKDFWELEKQVNKQAESIRYLKDEISKLKRGILPGQTKIKSSKKRGA